MALGCKIPIIDHTALGISRLATQYTESTNFIGFLTAFLTQSDDLETAAQQVLCERTIDDAEGVTLDHIGVLVGQSRTVRTANTTTYFGFDGSFNSGTFGSTGNTDGAIFRSLSDADFNTQTLTDADYRDFIRGRIIRNHTSGTIEEVISALRLFIPLPTTITISENYPASANITFSIGVDEELVAILFLNDLVPRPICVEYNVIIA